MVLDRCSSLFFSKEEGTMTGLAWLGPVKCENGFRNTCIYVRNVRVNAVNVVM